MTKYRDRLSEDYDSEIGSVVGCALDRLDRGVSFDDITAAVEYYNKNQSKLSQLPIGPRRELIADFISTGFTRSI